MEKISERVKNIEAWTTQYSREELMEMTLKMRLDACNKLSEPAQYYDCPKCNNSRIVAIRTKDGMTTSACDCDEIVKFLKQMENAGISKAYETYALEKFKANTPWRARMLELVTEYLESGGKHWLFLGGQCGAGKTHLATAVCCALMKKGKSGLYVPWVAKVNRLMSGYNGEEWTREVEKIKNAEVLYIDDIFRPVRENGEIRDPNGREQKLLQEILDYRYNNAGITILTSERQLSGILAINEGLGGRIKERCGKYCINISYDSTRDARCHPVEDEPSSPAGE